MLLIICIYLTNKPRSTVHKTLLNHIRATIFSHRFLSLVSSSASQGLDRRNAATIGAVSKGQKRAPTSRDASSAQGPPRSQSGGTERSHDSTRPPFTSRCMVAVESLAQAWSESSRVVSTVNLGVLPCVQSQLRSTAALRSIPAKVRSSAGCTASMLPPRTPNSEDTMPQKELRE